MTSAAIRNGSRGTPRRLRKTRESLWSWHGSKHRHPRKSGTRLSLGIRKLPTAARLKPITRKPRLEARLRPRQLPIPLSVYANLASCAPQEPSPRKSSTGSRHKSSGSRIHHEAPAQFRRGLFGCELAISGLLYGGSLEINGEHRVVTALIKQLTPLFADLRWEPRGSGRGSADGRPVGRYLAVSTQVKCRV